MFDSRLIWIDAKHVKLYLPDGNVESLTFDKGKNTLRGSGWLGELKGANNQVRLKAWCNCVLNFSGNRLASLRTPDGVTLTISRTSNGPLQLNRGGIPLVTLTPDWDKQTIQKFYRLKFSDKTAILKMGQRPVVVRDKGKPEKVVMAPALSEVHLNEKEARMFNIQKDGVLADGRFYQWDVLSNRLLAQDKVTFSYFSCSGFLCRKTTDAGGGVSITGTDSNSKVSVSGREGHIYLSEFFKTGIAKRKPRIIYRLLPSGEEVPYKTYTYDDRGMLKRMLVEEDGTKTLFFNEGNISKAVDFLTKKCFGKKHLMHKGEWFVFDTGINNFHSNMKTILTSLSSFLRTG